MRLADGRAPDLARPRWHIERVGEVTGRGVRVAIVDSGVEASPRMRVGTGVDFTGLDSDDPDLLGHGTACAQVVAAMAPDAEIVPVRVFGERLETSPQRLVGALDWCAEETVEVVNLSLGTTVASAFEPLRAACRRAVDAGCLVVSAKPRGAGPTAPADFPEVLSATLGSTDDLTNAWTLIRHADGDPADVSAPGVHRVVWRGEERLLAGSSLAAPHLTGHLALIRERFTGVPLEPVRQLLTELASAAHSTDVTRPVDRPPSA